MAKEQENPQAEVEQNPTNAPQTDTVTLTGATREEVSDRFHELKAAHTGDGTTLTAGCVYRDITGAYALKVTIKNN